MAAAEFTRRSLCVEGEREQVEDKLRAAFATINDALARLEDFVRAVCDWTWETDEHFSLTAASPGFTALMGVPARTLFGRYLLTLGTFRTLDVAAGDLPEFVRDRRPFRDLIFDIRDLNDRLHEVRLSGVPVFDRETERFLGYRGTASGILDPGLVLAAAKPMRADQRPPPEGNALATLSHEMRAPLNAIIGFSELALRQPHGDIDERYRDYVSVILTGARHLFSIVDGLTLSALPEDARSLLKAEPVSAARLIDEAVAMVLIGAREKGVEIRPLASAGDWMVLADPAAARRILLNLLDNAVKYTPAGGSVGLEIARAPDRTVAITVWDTGVGIAADRIGRIFERFYRVEGEPGADGLGLGLCIARRLAGAMDGDVTVTSVPGRGSRFTVRLPLAG